VLGASFKISTGSKGVWDSTGTKWSLVWWSLRYLRDYPEISVVLSGMSDINTSKITYRSQLKASLTPGQKRKKVNFQGKGNIQVKKRVNCTGFQ